jgi:hypothetical protein
MNRDVDKILNIGAVVHDGKRSAFRNRRNDGSFDPTLIGTCSGSSTDRHGL